MTQRVERGRLGDVRLEFLATSHHDFDDLRLLLFSHAALMRHDRIVQTEEILDLLAGSKVCVEIVDLLLLTMAIRSLKEAVEDYGTSLISTSNSRTIR